MSLTVILPAGPLTVVVDQRAGLPPIGRQAGRLPLAWPIKDPQDVRRYGLDYGQADGVCGDTLAGLSIDSPDPLIAIGAIRMLGQAGWVLIGGGTPGSVAAILTTATFASGQVIRRTIALPIDQPTAGPPPADLITVGGDPFVLGGNAIVPGDAA